MIAVSLDEYSESLKNNNQESTFPRLGMVASTQDVPQWPLSPWMQTLAGEIQSLRTHKLMTTSWPSYLHVIPSKGLPDLISVTN